MNKKLLVLILAVLLLGVLAFGPAEDILGVLALPFTALGAGLRWLSLSGSLGNAVALVLYGGVCLLPVLAWWRTGRKGEDWLLVLLGLVMVFVLYLMVNPALRPSLFQNEVGDVVYAGAVWSILVTWGVAKLLRSSEQIMEGNIYRALRIFLLICAASCLAEGFGIGIAELRQRIEALQPGGVFNPDPTMTYLFYGLEFVAGAVENGMLAVVFWRGVDLLKALERAPYSAECVAAGREVSRWCRRTLLTAAGMDLGLNLGQVFCGGMLYDVSVMVRLPIASMAVCFGMLALTRLLVQGKELKDESDLFI